MTSNSTQGNTASVVVMEIEGNRFVEVFPGFEINAALFGNMTRERFVKDYELGPDDLAEMRRQNRTLDQCVNAWLLARMTFVQEWGPELWPSADQFREIMGFYLLQQHDVWNEGKEPRFVQLQPRPDARPMAATVGITHRYTDGRNG